MNKIFCKDHPSIQMDKDFPCIECEFLKEALYCELNSMQPQLLIKVNEGNMFEGDLLCWEDVFFSFPDDFSTRDKLDQIEDFCERQNYRLEIS